MVVPPVPCSASVLGGGRLPSLVVCWGPSALCRWIMLGRAARPFPPCLCVLGAGGSGSLPADLTRVYLRLILGVFLLVWEKRLLRRSAPPFSLGAGPRWFRGRNRWGKGGGPLSDCLECRSSDEVAAVPGVGLFCCRCDLPVPDLLVCYRCGVGIFAGDYCADCRADLARPVAAAAGRAAVGAGVVE